MGYSMKEELDALCEEIMEDVFWIDEGGNACKDVAVVSSSSKRAYEAGRITEKNRCLDLVNNQESRR